MDFGPRQQCLESECPVLQLSLILPTVPGSLMGRACNEDPQVFGVGFLCIVAFVIANWEALSSTVEVK